MPKNSKNNNSYRNKYANLRNIADFSFKFDLRKKNDSEFTRSQKAEITRTYNQYQQMQNTYGEMPTITKKIRRLPHESDKKYRKRVKKLQKSQGENTSNLNVVTVPVVKGDVVKIVGDKIVKVRKRDGSSRKMTQFEYRINIDDKLDLFENPARVLRKYLEVHLDENPKHKRDKLLIGLDANGYTWKLGSTRSISYLAAQIYRDLMKYNVIGDTENIISRVLIRKMDFIKKNYMGDMKELYND